MKATTTTKRILAILILTAILALSLFGFPGNAAGVLAAIILAIAFVFVAPPLGYALMSAGEWMWGQQAIKLDPDNAGAHRFLGRAYLKAGKFKEAIESFKQALRIDPDHAEAHFYLGCVYFIMEDRGSALEEYNILKDLDGEMANNLFKLIYE
jgi:tetratricopeptide (TPR) repeat protein